MSTERQRPRVILVMGTHRSGTSAVTRVVNLLGAELGGALVPPGFDNPKGFWELAAAVKVNDDLLQGLGRTWYDMREMPADWLDSSAAQEARAQIARVIREDFSGRALCALKDPRLCLVAPLWIEAFEESGFEVSCLFVVRDPNAVVDSLHLRNDWRRAPLFLMWAQYLMEAEAGTSGCRRTMIAYEQLLLEWRSTMTRVADDLGLRWPVEFGAAASEIEGFLDRGRIDRNYKTADTPSAPARGLPKFIAELYEACLAIGHRKSGWDGIARLQKSFRNAAELYAAHVDNVLKERWAAEARAQAAQASFVGAEAAARSEWIKRVDDLGTDVARLSGSVDQVLVQLADVTKREEQSMADNERMQALEERLNRVENGAGERASALSTLELRIQRRLDRQERLLQTLHRQLEDVEPALRRRDEALGQRLQDLERKMWASDDAAATIEGLAERIHALTSSTSWRVTAPLRWLKMRLWPRARG